MTLATVSINVACIETASFQTAVLSVCTYHSHMASVAAREKSRPSSTNHLLSLQLTITDTDFGKLLNRI